MSQQLQEVAEAQYNSTNVSRRVRPRTIEQTIVLTVSMFSTLFFNKIKNEE